MSVSYWGIIGYGLCIDDIYKFINHEKVKHYVKKMVPEIEIDDEEEQHAEEGIGEVSSEDSDGHKIEDPDPSAEDDGLIIIDSDDD